MWKAYKNKKMNFSKSRPFAGQHQQNGKALFFKIEAARLEIRAQVSKNARLEFGKKLIGYGILPSARVEFAR